MNRKQFLILVVALAVLAVAAAAVVLSERSAWSNAESRIGHKLVAGLRIAAVAEIAIKDAAGEVHLVRAEGGWQVRERAGFAADVGRIGGLLITVAELKIIQDEALLADQRERLQLLEPKEKSAAGAGTLLELKDAKGALLARLLLGKKILRESETAAPGGTGQASGRQIVAGSDAGRVLAVSEPLAEAEARPEQWLVKDLIRVEHAKSIAASSGGKPRWVLRRASEAADWGFAGLAGKPDLQKATDIAGAFSWLNLVDVVPEPGRIDTGLERGLRVTAETFDGLAYTLRIGNPDGANRYLGISVAGEPRGERIPAKGESAEDKAKKDKEFEERRKQRVEELEREKKLGRWTYLVTGTSIAPLLRERAEFLPDKKKDAGKRAG